jgi:hypothetical protein
MDQVKCKPKYKLSDPLMLVGNFRIDVRYVIHLNINIDCVGKEGRINLQNLQMITILPIILIS